MSVADKNYMCAAFVLGMAIILMIMWMNMTFDTTQHMSERTISFFPFNCEYCLHASRVFAFLCKFGVPHNLTSLDLDSFNVMNKSVAFPLSL